MPRGPKPKPTNIKILHGNRGHRPLPQGEPRPDDTMPDPPVPLGELALEEWYRVGTELHRIGVLTMADRQVLASYCDAYERWYLASEELRDARDYLTTNAAGTLVAHPYVAIANKAMELMLKHMGELGLTPSSRVRLAAGKTHEQDALGAFLQQKTPGRKKQV